MTVYRCYADTWELEDYTLIEVITTITIYCKTNQKMTYTLSIWNIIPYNKKIEIKESLNI